MALPNTETPVSLLLHHHVLRFNNLVLHKGMEEMSKLGSEWRGEVDLDIRNLLTSD
jgi:hypothetical protein